MPAPRRTPSGYRVYGDGDRTRLSFILKAKRLGLSLEEIKGILQLHNRSEPTCVHVRSLLEDKLDQVHRVIAELQEFRADLINLDLINLRDEAGGLVDCRPLGGEICGIGEAASRREPATGCPSSSSWNRWPDRP